MTRLSLTKPVLLVGGAEVIEADFREARAHTGFILAVDGGANTLAAWGVNPDAVIGDMDSIDSDPPDTAQIIRINEQDSTDLEKALREVTAPFYIGIGFLGGRLDHTLAAMHALIRYAEKPVILVGADDIVFASPGNWSASLAAGDRISFYPVRSVTAERSSGLRWPLEGLRMEGGELIGTSNETAAVDISAEFATPGAVTILPKRWLAEAIDSLTNKKPPNQSPAVYKS